MEPQILISIRPEELYLKISEIVEKKLLENNHYIAIKGGQSFAKKPILSLKEVCELFQITKPTIYEWQQKNLLKPKKINGRVYYLNQDIEELITQKKE